MIVVRVDGQLQRSSKGRVKTYGRREDVLAFFRSRNEDLLRKQHNVTIEDLSKKELREVNG